MGVRTWFREIEVFFQQVRDQTEHGYEPAQRGTHDVEIDEREGGHLPRSLKMSRSFWLLFRG